MKRVICAILSVICISLSACGKDINIIGGSDGPTQITVSEKGEKTMYEQITQEEAKRIMDLENDFIILDVREQDEFDEGHIPDAILIPYTEIDEKAENILPDKDKLLLVYCRSGRRSKIAAEALSGLGYTNVKEFGGIIDWKYDIVK